MHAGFDPDRDVPDGMSEADLLAYVEADAAQISAARPESILGRVESARRSDARLAAMLDAMRIDRAAMGSLDAPAPSESVAIAVLEEHERQSLLALSDMATRGPRAAREQDDESFSFSAMPRWFKPSLAVAAALAIAFGAWQLGPLLLPQQPVTPGPAVAIEDGDTNESPSATPPDDPIAIATMERQAPIAPGPQPLIPSAEQVLAARLDMPVSDALEVAREGRLLILVDVKKSAVAIDAASRLAERPVDATWRLRDADGELIAAMATPAHARIIGLEDAGDGLLAESRGPIGQIEVVMASAPMVSMAEASASPAAMLALLDGLGHLGESIRVVTLDEPLPGAGTIDPAADDFSVLWWNDDPATWQPRAAIPVRFVESR
jgi:hypothetical protein